MTGLFLFSGCAGFPLLGNDPAPPSSFAPLLQTSLLLAPAKIEINNLEPLPGHLPAFTIPDEADKSMDPPSAPLSLESWEDLPSPSISQIDEPIPTQCPSPEPLFVQAQEEVARLDPLLPSAEEWAFAESRESGQHLEFLAEEIFEELYEGLVSLTSLETFCEGSNIFQDGLGPGEEFSSQPFSLLEEDFSSQPLSLLEAAPAKDARKGKAPEAISAIFPSLFNDRVKEFIYFFQTRGDAFFHRALSRSQAYEEMMKKILREKNLPEELFYLALIESGYNPKAFSRARASGIWQFVGKTGKRFGLKVDKWVDERRDPEKSTYAAAEYLRNLYAVFNDWDLVAAGYNAGEAKILKAMKKAKSQDFWEISKYRYLKKETKKYVPMFLAAVLIANEPHKYGFSNLDYHPPLLYEKVLVPPATSLELIAKAAETDLSEIQALNPALKKGKAPPDCSQFEIKIPSGKKEIFEKNFPALTRKIADKSKVHRIRRGDTLGRIAKNYRVDLQDLCRVNGLTPQDRLKPGSILYLPR